MSGSNEIVSILLVSPAELLVIRQFHNRGEERRKNFLDN